MVRKNNTLKIVLLLLVILAFIFVMSGGVESAEAPACPTPYCQGTYQYCDANYWAY